MSIECPKCGYVRQSKEDAPDWQCPSCGVAYVKAAQAAHRERAMVPVKRTVWQTACAKWPLLRASSTIGVVLASAVALWVVVPIANDAYVIASAKARLKNDLIDPESVKWENVRVFKNARWFWDNPEVCGEFNSKNRMGGYSGFDTFYVKGNLLETHEKDITGASTEFIACRLINLYERANPHAVP